VLFYIVIIFHNISVVTVFLNQINAAFEHNRLISKTLKMTCSVTKKYCQ